jgi:Arc/MetJ family transcription regulator
MPKRMKKLAERLAGAMKKRALKKSKKSEAVGKAMRKTYGAAITAKEMAAMKKKKKAKKISGALARAARGAMKYKK